MTASIQAVEIGGQTVWVEMQDVPVSAPAAGKFAPTAAAGDVKDALKRGDVSSALRAVLAEINDGFDRFKPDEVAAELSIGFKADVGVFVASSEASAQIRISMKWKPGA